MKTTSNIFMCALLAVAPVTAQLPAQTLREVRDSTVAQECRARAVEFSRSPAAAEVFLLADCAVTGPQVLAEAWRSLSGPESGALLQLMTTSSVLPDVRLARVLLERAEDSSAPLLVRRAAVATLAGFLDSSYWPNVGANYTYPSVIEVSLAQRSHGHHKPVLEPVDEAFLDDIRARLVALAASAAPYPLKSLAKRASGVTPR